MSLGLILWSVLPGLLWAHWLYKRDAFQPEPLPLVAKAFLVGMLLTIPSVYFSSLLRDLPSMDVALVETDWLWSLKAAFLITGPVEEGLKFAAVYVLFLHHKDFDEPIDGLIYTGTVALGFASAENIVYLARYGADVIVLRALLSVPGHFLFAASFGYAMGMRTVDGPPIPNRRLPPAPWDLGLGLFIAICAHGAYNFFLLVGHHYQEPVWGWGGSLCILGVLTLLWRSYVRRLDDLSPFSNAQMANTPA